MRLTRLQASRRADMREQVIEKIKNNSALHPITTGTTRVISAIQNPAEDSVAAGVFPLLNLPPELQNMVFGHVVVAAPDDILMLENTTTPPLARVNRYLRKTVLPIFARVNTFHVITDRETGFNLQGSVMEWFDPLGHDTPLVRSLIIHFVVEMRSKLFFQHSCEGRGLTVNINSTSRFWVDKLDTEFPALARRYVAYLTSEPDSFTERVGSVGELYSIIIMGVLGAEVDIKRGGLFKGAQGISMTDMMRVERATHYDTMIGVVTLLKKIETTCEVLHQSSNQDKDKAVAIFAAIGSDLRLSTSTT